MRVTRNTHLICGRFVPYIVCSTDCLVLFGGSSVPGSGILSSCVSGSPCKTNFIDLDLYAYYHMIIQ